MQLASCHSVENARYPFTFFPTGWYRIGASASLKRGGVQALRCLGRDFVLFRAEDGRAALMDAYCPHLGAHLGHGGKVVGNDVQCPFHGWRIRRDGTCGGVPGGGVVPSRARIATWTLRETAGSLYFWFHPEGEPPGWELPEIAERSAPGWTPFRTQRSVTVRTHMQEIAENGVDLAHFSFVHGSQIERATTRMLLVDGTMLRHEIEKSLRLFGLAGHALPRARGSLEFIYHGLGMVVCRARVLDFPRVDFTSVIHLLPIDAEHVRLDAEFSMRRRGPFTWPLYALAAREARRAITDDTTILAKKAYLPRPRLSDLDGPIMQFRKWAQQFYDDAPAAEPVTDGSMAMPAAAPRDLPERIPAAPVT